jgi:hypothetical protein
VSEAIPKGVLGYRLVGVYPGDEVRGIPYREAWANPVEPDDTPARVASLEDWVRELRVEVRDHELRLKEIAEVAKGWRT